MNDDEWNAHMQRIDENHAKIMRNYRLQIGMMIFLLAELVVFASLIAFGMVAL